MDERNAERERPALERRAKAGAEEEARRLERKLDEALADTFPASDPIQWGELPRAECPKDRERG